MALPPWDQDQDQDAQVPVYLALALAYQAERQQMASAWGPLEAQAQAQGGDPAAACHWGGTASVSQAKGELSAPFRFRVAAPGSRSRAAGLKAMLLNE